MAVHELPRAMKRGAGVAGLVTCVGLALGACSSSGDDSPQRPPETATVSTVAQVKGPLAGVTAAECAANRTTMEIAVQAYEALEGHLPASEEDLVTAGLIREVSPTYDVDADGRIVPSPASTCS